MNNLPNKWQDEPDRNEVISALADLNSVSTEEAIKIAEEYLNQLKISWFRYFTTEEEFLTDLMGISFGKKVSPQALAEIIEIVDPARLAAKVESYGHSMVKVGDKFYVLPNPNFPEIKPWLC